MSEALSRAEEAAKSGEVPVGAIIVNSSGIIAKTSNLVESCNDPTAHAEVLAIRQAAKQLNSWRLNDCILCVTLEPCSMCLGAIKLARIPVLVFGASDAEKGACGSLFNLAQDKRLGAETEVISGIKEKECAEILRKFFEAKR